MDKKPFLILIASQKGGVGKTTVALNLAVALRYRDFNVLLVDTDMESASATEQLGIQLDGKGYADIVKGEADIPEVLFAYEPINLYVIPGSPSRSVNELDPKDLAKFYSKLTKLKYDFIIIDSPPGLFPEFIARYLDDVAILTTPDPVSSISSSRIAMYCSECRLEHRLIINRMGYSKFDLEKEEVEKLFGDVAFQVIPEDKIVPESILKHKPAYMIDKDSDFSLAIDELAREYTLKISLLSNSTENFGKEEERQTKPSLFEKLAGWFFKSK